MNVLFKSILIFTFVILIPISPTIAARDTNSFDGNIFPIYSGNGSLVPPQSTLENSIKNNRTSVLIFYLDDSATSKNFAPVVSGLKLLWNSSIDIIPLTTDELQNREINGKSDPAYFWHGNIPETVVLSGDGEVFLDEEGQVPIKKINEAIVKASGLNPPEFDIEIKTFNEYSSEPSKEGYTDPR